MTNLVNNEEQKTFSKLAVACLVVLSRHLPELIEENHNTAVGLDCLRIWM
jgi:hypothetical protein